MSDTQANRSKTITWEDPLPGVSKGKTLSGLAYLQAIQEKELPAPPVAKLLGMNISEVNEGRVVFTLTPDESHYNPLGTVHGGIIATLLDSAMGCAVQSQLQVGQWYTTAEIKVNYLRPLMEATGEVFCEGKVLYLGGRIATAEGKLTDQAGKLYAHSTTTCLILRS